MFDINEIKKLRIRVLMGGYSSEREISLKSGTAVLTALQASGCQAQGLDITSSNDSEIFGQIKQVGMDVAFIALHGHLGEDGRIQEILEKCDIPYTGSGIESSRIAMNKIFTYQRLAQNSLRVPDYQIFDKTRDLNSFLKEDFLFPLVVKPCAEGSSIGINLVRKHEELAPAIEKALSYDTQALVERYIRGKELTVGVLENTLLPVVEIQHQKDFFDFSAKYQAGMTRYIVPAQMSARLTHEAQEIGFRVHQLIGCRHFSRTDIILDENEKMHVLEINTIPGFTETSLLPKAARSAGIDFSHLCMMLIHMAYGTKN